jgi:hypothetical protein
MATQRSMAAMYVPILESGITSHFGSLMVTCKKHWFLLRYHPVPRLPHAQTSIPKLPILVYLGRPKMETFAAFMAIQYFYCHLGNFCGLFGVYFPILVCSKNLKNLATLAGIHLN